MRQTLLDSVSSPDGNGAALVKVDINSAPDEAPQKALLPAPQGTEPTPPQDVFRLQFKGTENPGMCSLAFPPVAIAKTSSMLQRQLMPKE